MSQSKGLKSDWTMEGDRAKCHLCDFEGFLGREILYDEDESNASIILSVTVSKENNDNMFDCTQIEVKFKF